MNHLSSVYSIPLVKFLKNVEDEPLPHLRSSTKVVDYYLQEHIIIQTMIYSFTGK